MDSPSEIVTRLRKWAEFGYGKEASDTMREAAATIEQLQHELFIAQDGEPLFDTSPPPPPPSPDRLSASPQPGEQKEREK